METKSALSVFNDAMKLVKKVNNRYYQKKELECKAWVFMIHNLLKGENFPVDDWFEDYGSDLFEVFEAYYSEHDCWDGFKENILNCSGKMYALFVAVVYAQEQRIRNAKRLVSGRYLKIKPLMMVSWIF